MKWTPGGQSDDIEDIRGQGGGGGGGRGLAMPLTGGGIVVAVVLALLSQVFGVNLTGGGSDPSGGYSSQSQSPQPQQRRAGAQGPRGADDPQQQEMQFISFVLDDVQK